MSGRRRKPWIVQKTIGWEWDEGRGRCRQKLAIIGYAATKAEGLQMLMDYNKHPFDLQDSKTTFREVYARWSAEKFPTITRSNVNGYRAAYQLCATLYNIAFRELKLADLQGVVDNCGKNYPTLRKLKSLLSQLYAYALKNDICTKDYAAYVDISRYRDRNPDKRDRNKFTKAEIDRLWACADDPDCQIVLMLIYNGCRISEFLDLKKEHVHLDAQYFEVVASKTENGLRRVPIADKMLPFYRAWFGASDGTYLLCSRRKRHFSYRNYYEGYFIPLMARLGFDHKPHDTRHTCISLLTEAHVDQTVIKKIVGHAGAMSLTERVYTHLDIETLVEAVNRI